MINHAPTMDGINKRATDFRRSVAHYRTKSLRITVNLPKAAREKAKGKKVKR